MLNIKELSFCDYLSGFELRLPNLGIHLLNSTMKKDGILLGAYIDCGLDKKLVGIIVFKLSERPNINYIFVEENFRSQGIGTRLLEAALSSAKDKAIDLLEASTVLQNPFGEITDHMLKKAGFEIYDTATVIRYANDAKCRGGWDLFMNERGSRICNGLAKRGFVTLSFAEATGSVFERLKEAMIDDFPNNLNPFNFFSDEEQRVVRDYSFITLKNDEPAAFVTVTTLDDKTLVFQQLSAAFKHQGNGAFLLPFAAFMERFLAGNTYSKAAAIVYDRNDKMQKLVNSFIGPLAESIKTQNLYKQNL
jgi:GNAT superfamily N-acetyltransferase